MRDLTKFHGCPSPEPVMLRGRLAIVEPYDRSRHLRALWDGVGGMGVNALLAYFAQDDFTGLDDFDAWLDEVQTNRGWLTHVFCDRATAGIVGMASYMRADPANGVVEIGAVAHGPAMARSTLSTEVHFLMARHVFEVLGYRRYEWKCHNENAASKAAAERYGFTFEGIFRQHMLSKHRNRDTAWFSIIDGEWPLLARAFETWLTPNNFHADGSQIRRLGDIRAELAKEAVA